MTVRSVEVCTDLRLQEFARIIFVDDITNYSKTARDHEPLKKRPAYESLDVPKVTLNDPYTDGTNSKSYCVAALQYKNSVGSVHENLRNVSAKVIPFKLNYKLIESRNRPNNFKIMVGVVNNISGTHSLVPGYVRDGSDVAYYNANQLPDDYDGEPICFCPHLVELELCKVYELLLIDVRAKMPLKVSSLGWVLVLVQILNLISMSLTKEIEFSLTHNELRKKYGQANTTFNDGRSCDRVCDGKKKTCYYEFVAQVYDTMSGLCGKCENGTISDCFRDGCITANGVPRIIMTTNHEFPGPSINTCKNDRIIVDVTNQMAGQELTFHWHGLHQKESPWFDGVPMVTQCPIFAGNTFRYVFNAQDAGTHLYHAHSGLHRSNGLIGKLNVRDPDDPNADYYDYDLSEHSILLSDWDNMMAEENAPGTRTLVPETAQLDSLLINGLGNYFDPKVGKFTYAPIAVLYVERGRRHRFRIINAASHTCPFELSIKGHNLTVIATDGFPIEPVVVDCVVSSAGERYDVVMNAMDDSSLSEVVMTVRALEACRDLRLQEFARIIFVDDITNYSKTAKDHEPLKKRPAYESLDVPKVTLNDPYTDCTNSKSYCVAALQYKNSVGSVRENLRNVSAKVIPFKFTYKLIEGRKRPSHFKTFALRAMAGVVNNIANTHSVPGLIQDDSDVAYCNANQLPDDCDGESICFCPHLVELELCKVYEFLLIDDRDPGGNVSHPIHLHGYGFQVVDMGTKDEYESGQTAFTNATHLPVVKDTVIVPNNGFVKIKLRTCNPGYWLFHCHLEYHMHTGMTLTVKVGDRTDMLPPPANFPTCGNFLMPIHK